MRLASTATRGESSSVIAGWYGQSPRAARSLRRALSAEQRARRLAEDIGVPVHVRRRWSPATSGPCCGTASAARRGRARRGAGSATASWSSAAAASAPVRGGVGLNAYSARQPSLDTCHGARPRRSTAATPASQRSPSGSMPVERLVGQDVPQGRPGRRHRERIARQRPADARRRRRRRPSSSVATRLRDLVAQAIGATGDAAGDRLADDQHVGREAVRARCSRPGPRRWCGSRRSSGACPSAG